MSPSTATPMNTQMTIEQRISALLEQMTLAEKIGQMSQINGAGGELALVE